MRSMSIKGDFYKKIGIIIFILLVCFGGTHFCNNTNNMISGIVWDDENQNGVLDNGESRIQNVKIIIYDSDGNEKENCLTNENGEYTLNKPNYDYRLKLEYESNYTANGIYKTANVSNTQEKNPFIDVVYTSPEGSEYTSIIDNIRSGLNVQVNNSFKDNDVIYYTDKEIKDKNGNSYTLKDGNPFTSIYDIYKNNNCAQRFGMLPNVAQLKCVNIIFANNNIKKSSIRKDTIDSSKVNYIVLYTDDADDTTRQYVKNIDSKLIKVGELNNYSNVLNNSLPEGLSYNKNNQSSIENINIIEKQNSVAAISKVINSSENVSSINIALSKVNDVTNDTNNGTSENKDNWGNDTGNNEIKNTVTVRRKGHVRYTYVSGKIFENKEENLVKDWIGVRLVSDNGNIVKQILTNTGEYYFDVTDLRGKYKIQFIHGTGKLYGFSEKNVMNSVSEIGSSDWENNVTTIKSYKDVINYQTWNEAKVVHDVEDSDSWKRVFSSDVYNKYLVISESKPFNLNGSSGKKVSMGLTSRGDALELNLKKDLTAAKISLSNGSTLKEEVFSEDTPNDLPLYWYIDDEIMLGATISLEYQIKLSSNYDVQIDLLDYLSYNTGSIMYNENDNLISSADNNSNSGLTVINNVEANKLINSNIELVDGKTYLKGSKFDVKKGQEYTIKFKVSKLVTPNEEELTYENEAEVISYKLSDDNETARIDWKNIPGNYNINDIQDNRKNYAINQSDADYTRQFIITKPTGIKIRKNNITNMFMRIKKYSY